MSSNKHQLRTKSTVATRTLLKKIGYSGAILAMVVALNNSFSGLFNQQYMLIQAGNTLAVGGDLVNEDTLIIEGHLELSGDLINQEFMDCGNCQDGMVTFTNSYQNPQTIGGISPINLYQIKVLTSGGIDLENEVKIRHKVFFTGGGMRSERGNPNYFLHLFDSASIEGLSDSLHVNGYVGYTGDSTFTFPIGDGQSLRPVTIEPAGGSGFYQAAYFPHDPNQNTALAGSPFPRTAMDVSQLGAIHEQEYWDINGTEIGILTFTWNPGSHINQWLNDLQELVVVGWNGTRWESLGQTALNGDINQGSISSMPVVPNDYQAYTLGSSGSCGGNLTRLADIGLQADMGQSWNVSFGDYDNDGYEDVFVGEFFHWKGNYLYKNNQDGTFSRVSVGDLTSDKGATGGSTWGDFDNDGDLDIFVANVVRADNHLYENNGDGTFTRLDAGDVSHYAGYCHNASWVDYNNDGLLDIFASDYMPTRYNQLYHNNGDGTFSSATDNPIALEAKFSMGATWGDYDNDGLLDLFVPNGRNAHNSLYHNDGNGKFTKIASGPVVTDGGNSGGSSWADVDNDGDLDLYVTNASNQPNFFYLNQGDGTFVKNTTSIIATEAGHSHGSAWGDIDNDGDQDLYVTNDQNKVNRLYLNDGSGNFTLAAGGINSDTDNSFAAAFADIDNDGDLDLLSGNVNEINTLYQNQSSLCSNWKCIKLVGTKSNRAAIGAKIRVKATVNGQSFWQLREISGQTGGGSSAQNSLKAHFGLGDATQIDSIIIDWPSGFEQRLTNVAINDCQTIEEDNGVLIAGKVYNDLNENCQMDPGEAGIPNIRIEVNPGKKYMVTDENGEYRMYREYGDYQVSIVDDSAWSFNCTNEHQISYTSDVNNLFNYTNYHFSARPLCEDPDLSVSLSSTALRLGFRNTFAVSYINTGAGAAENVELVVDFHQDIVILSADNPWDAVQSIDSINRYTWNLGTLASMGRGTIMFADSVSTDATMGRMMETRAYFNTTSADCDSSDNLRTSFDEIVGAVDPNDKLVWPEGNVLASDTLHYTVRFQNVGSSYAKRVLILDTLSQHLDWGSFEIEEASHAYKVNISDGGIVEFVFDHIYLADSVSNEPESHGFISYRISPKTGVAVGTYIYNRAAIQFDYAEFIITNQTANRVVNKKKSLEKPPFKLLIRPNPMITESRLSIRHEEDALRSLDITQVEIFTLSGQLIDRKAGLKQAEFVLDRQQLKQGIYLLRAWDAYGFNYSGKLVVK